MPGALITGANGTVGRNVVNELKAHGWDIIKWNRNLIPPLSRTAAEKFLDQTDPEVVYHLAIASSFTGVDNEAYLINVKWPEQLAQICGDRNIRYIFTSTVMVFNEFQAGPFSLNSIPAEKEGYGFQKLSAENRIRLVNPAATVVRLGWQIGEADGSNNMVEYFSRQMRDNGFVKTNKNWLPACSFLPETARQLRVLANMPAGVYMVDSNDGWTFCDIARALNDMGNRGWKIIPEDGRVWDQRMQDDRLSIKTLSEYFIK